MEASSKKSQLTYGDLAWRVFTAREEQKWFAIVSFYLAILDSLSGLPPKYLSGQTLFSVWDLMRSGQSKAGYRIKDMKRGRGKIISQKFFIVVNGYDGAKWSAINRPFGIMVCDKSMCRTKSWPVQKLYVRTMYTTCDAGINCWACNVEIGLQLVSEI